MGDGLLAIFQTATARPPSESCDAALAAASDAFDALARLNRRRDAAGQRSIRFGLGLHVGDVAYGNIGGSGRLDFTCIGPAVNIAARIESLASHLELPVLVSREFAQLSTRALRPVGTFELKGVDAPTEVFVPAD
jgi:adenylate cyclase